MAILKLPRPAIQALVRFSKEKWNNYKQRNDLLLQACLNAIPTLQGRCGKGCGMSFREMTSKDSYCIDFHHSDERSKYFSLAQMQGLPAFIIVAELRKCVAVCSNCHRGDTYG